MKKKKQVTGIGKQTKTHTHFECEKKAMNFEQTIEQE